MNTIKYEITTFHWLFKPDLIPTKKWSKKFYKFIYLIIIMICMLLLFECITCSSSWFLEDVKLNNMVSWIFHVSDIFALFLMFFSYGLILLYFSIDSVLFLSPLLSYLIKLLLQKIRVCNNLVLHAQKGC